MPMLEPMLASFMSDLVLTWIPIIFLLLMCAVVYLLWRTVKLMPRVKPTEIIPGSASSVTWDDVAGLDEARTTACTTAWRKAGVEFASLDEAVSLLQAAPVAADN